jgi:hypothetical protein
MASRRQREGYYAGYHHGHVRSRWPRCAPFSSLAYGWLQTRNGSLRERHGSIIDFFLSDFVGWDNPVLLRAAQEAFGAALTREVERRG